MLFSVCCIFTVHVFTVCYCLAGCRRNTDNNKPRRLIIDGHGPTDEPDSVEASLRVGAVRKGDAGVCRSFLEHVAVSLEEHAATPPAARDEAGAAAIGPGGSAERRPRAPAGRPTP